MDIGIGLGEYTLEVAVTLFAWIVANWAYLDFRRTGTRGFKRLVAFWMGWPATFLSLLVVRDGSQPRIQADDSGLEDLVHQIRRDRLMRGGDPGSPLGELVDEIHRDRWEGRDDPRAPGGDGEPPEGSAGQK